ncbi:Tetrapyrrole biosynthesis uroporphyrinogen III synthase [Penicillium odoratum]|uniref:Tetrapyrrole biosynthesis uroporphyrinogen III synthase n=1 Tax=Penicillium odoratum TaxID=1167516 RepID=UPI002547FFBA|nr:Tetrapyrrole biosynthesis uroporphyrinogen III synthase [Penicillium odoratum]KAJ5777670.1 Tetrapyrrole biosynthesis uroporphyrinogen III synthase [Penicillium odoratum]
MPSTPILLLKTRSSPHDGYDDFLSAQGYNPSFIPVLEHRFNTKNLAQVRDLFASGAFEPNATNKDETEKKYGGMIFTSQRAVEGFAKMIEQDGREFRIIPTRASQEASRTNNILTNINLVPQPSNPIPLYTVGPATARTLTTLRDKYLPTATIHGAESGTGENLAHLMLQHYNSLHPRTSQDQSPKPGLLFLVGEQRRDIIPKTLMSESLPVEERIAVDERVVYETGEMEGFERDFERSVSACGDCWVVVFSPSGCEAMLRVLKLGPFAGDEDGGGERRLFVATIGPTTRDYLKNMFGFEADVCAEKPSPEGVVEGIRRFVDLRKSL